MKKEKLEEAAEKYVKDSSHELYELRKQCFLDGAKWQQEQDNNKYSEEEVEKIIAETWITCVYNDGKYFTDNRNKILKQFKKK